MSKTITLNEKDLKNLIHETISDWTLRKRKGLKYSIDEVVSYNMFNKGLLSEMSLKRKEFINHLISLKQELIENWCLCYYCSLYDKDNKNFSHWEGEFGSYAKRIKGCSIKGGDKKEAMYETYLAKFDLNKPYVIAALISEKFSEEGINEKYIYLVANGFTASLVQLISFLCSDKDSSVTSYITQTFEAN